MCPLSESFVSASCVWTTAQLCCHTHQCFFPAGGQTLWPTSRADHPPSSTFENHSWVFRNEQAGGLDATITVSWSFAECRSVDLKSLSVRVLLVLAKWSQRGLRTKPHTRGDPPVHTQPAHTYHILTTSYTWLSHLCWAVQSSHGTQREFEVGFNLLTLLKSPQGHL